MNKKTIYIVLLTLLFGVSNVYSQENKLIKNSLSIETSNHYFFDGNSFIQKPFFGYIHHRIEYMRKINKRHFWAGSIDVFDYTNVSPITKMEAGTIFSRNYLEVGASYFYSLYEFKRQQLFFNTGVRFRVGNESLFGGYWFNPNILFGESFIHTKSLIDVGVSIGLKYKYYLGKHFNINASFTHTLYPYTYDKKSEFYDWDREPSWNTLSLSFGVGFNFGE